MLTNNLYILWAESRTRFTKQLETITENDLSKKLHPSPNSAGFLIRHIGDVEMLFAKNVFQIKDLQVHAKTVIDQKDTGVWINLLELKEYVTQSGLILQKSILDMNEERWQQTITTKEFGTRKMAEALGRISSHTAYHAGQLSIIIKYGNN